MRFGRRLLLALLQRSEDPRDAGLGIRTLALVLYVVGLRLGAGGEVRLQKTVAIRIGLDDLLDRSVEGQRLAIRTDELDATLLPGRLGEADDLAVLDLEMRTVDLTR